MSRAWRRGSTRAWRKMRAVVLLRNQAENGGRCRLQLTVCTGVATQVHHTHGRAQTGDDPRYLVAVCAACNLEVGDPQSQPDPPHAVSHRW